MKQGISTSRKAVVGDTNLPATGSGYVPIVGTPPPPDEGPMLDGASESTFTPEYVSISSLIPGETVTLGDGTTKKIEKVKSFYIFIDALEQTYKNSSGQWVPADPNNLPFNVDSSIVDAPKEKVKSDEQYIIETPVNTEYTDPLPANLKIQFTLSDQGGGNSVSGSYTITRV